MPRYKVNESFDVVLGDIIDPLFPDEDKTNLNYFKVDNPRDSASDAGGGLQLQFKFIKTFDEYIELKGVDAALNANIAMMKASASTSYRHEFEEKETNVYIAASERKNFAETVRTGNPVLTDEAKALLGLPDNVDAQMAARWAQITGTEYVSRITKGAHVFVLIAFKTSHKKDAESIKVALTAKSGGVKGGIHLRNEASKVANIDDLAIYVDVAGFDKKGVGYKNLLKIRSIHEIDQIIKIVNDSFDEVDETKATIIEFETLILKNIPDIFGNTTLSDACENYYRNGQSALKLAQLSLEYWNRLTNSYDQAKTILEKYAGLFTEKGKVAAKKQRDALRELLLKVGRDYSKVQQLTLQTLDQPEIPEFVWENQFNTPFVIPASWETKHYLWPGHHIFGDFYFYWQACVKILLPEFVESVTLFNGDKIVGSLQKTEILKQSETDQIFKIGQRMQTQAYNKNYINARTAWESEVERYARVEEQGKDYRCEIKTTHGKTQEIYLGNFYEAHQYPKKELDKVG